MSARTRRPASEIQRWRVDPDLPGLEARLAVYRRSVFSRHIHDTWNVGLVVSGATWVWRNGGTQRLPAGAVACIRPGEPHACNPVPNGQLCSLMFYIRSDALRFLTGRDSEPAFVAPLLYDPVGVRQLAGFFRMLGGPIAPLEKQTWFCRLFAPFFVEAPRRGERSKPHPDVVPRARAYLQQHYRQPVALADLAALTDCSPSHLLRLFKREAGLPPHAYQNFLRIEQAKSLLVQGMPAVQVAQEVGFADQSHFIRTFTPLVGVTPRRFRLSLQA